ncbi:MAG: GDYXXLXY domain-containing protein [Pseudomonadota bacterium]
MSNAASLSVKPKPFLLPGALLAALLLCGLIAWMIESRASILRDGNELVLKTEPVDPRDLLRGRYVRLNYAASNVFVPAVGFGDGDHEQFPDFGREVFVTFEPGDDGFHKPVAAFATPPGDGLFLRGESGGVEQVGFANAMERECQFRHRPLLYQ